MDSREVRRSTASVCTTFATRLRWVSITPLGNRSCRWNRAAPRHPRGRRIATAGGGPADGSAANGVGALRLAENEHLPDGGADDRFARLVEKLRNGHQVRRAGVLELSVQLSGRVERIDRGHRSTGNGDTEKGDRVLRQVRAVDGEDVAPGESARGQPGGGGAGGRVQLSVGQRAAGRAVDQRRLVGPLVHVLEHVVRQRDVRNLHVGKRAAVEHRYLGLHPKPPAG